MTNPVEKPGLHIKEGFLDLLFRYWRRGWLILLLVVCIGVLERMVVYLLRTPRLQESGLYLVLVLCLGVLLVPAGAYWLFVLFFGEDAWPWSAPEPKTSAESQAFCLLNEATRAEAQGKVQDALAKYQEIVDKFTGTSASRDAQLSMESLRAKLL
jgi:hypothetical protein